MTTLKEAKQILGENNIFGPEEWLRFFSKEIPDAAVFGTTYENLHYRYTKEAIKDFPHFLFLGIDWTKCKTTPNTLPKWAGYHPVYCSLPYTLPMWHSYFNGPEHPKFDDAKGLKLDVQDGFEYGTCMSRWYLMYIGTPQMSMDFSDYDMQEAFLPIGYEVPNAYERVTANILFYLLNKKYLDTTFAVKTKTLWAGKYHLAIRGDPDNGIQVFPAIPAIENNSLGSSVNIQINLSDATSNPGGIAACLKTI
jgi:hypothetical protein